MQRHESAQEQLSKETDFFKFLKLLRVTQFLSRVQLLKYQRNLVPYFKKYQLTELAGDKRELTKYERLLKNSSQITKISEGDQEEIEKGHRKQ